MPPDGRTQACSEVPGQEIEPEPEQFSRPKYHVFHYIMGQQSARLWEIIQDKNTGSFQQSEGDRREGEIKGEGKIID